MHKKNFSKGKRVSMYRLNEKSAIKITFNKKNRIRIFSKKENKNFFSMAYASIFVLTRKIKNGL
jgi:hypothetical protein